MSKFSVYLSQFDSLRPPHETAQSDTLKWLVDAHVQAEKLQKPDLSEKELQGFRLELEDRLLHVGCKSDNISKRGHCFDDFLHKDWSKMKVYQLSDKPTGVGLAVRSNYFDQFAENAFDHFYNDNRAPKDLIHVSCTGYTAPSSAQRLVSKKGWGEQTHITHAYHMGCYGSMPAIRMARGFLAESKLQEQTSEVDIVHTEICSLHTNPSSHLSGQLVAQSLFADGFIKYTASINPPKHHSLKVLTVHEQVIPNSMKSMTWNISDWGFDLFLAKDIPVKIARMLPSYIERLFSQAGIEMKHMKDAAFAVHPGGPKILQHIQELLQLSDDQLRHSRKVLYDCGNMSSATLPHIWQRMLQEEEVKVGTPIVSLAFGPGLSVCGAIMEKC